MNEITKIHLGRVAFTIAVDAHRELREYLDAIKKHVGAKHEEVLEEIELRMAELLTERGVTGEKVVVVKDVDYLREQLGSPSDFEDDEEETASTGNGSEGSNQSRRLYRDPRDQIFGGVASGLGAYFGINAWIFRLIFLMLTFAGASGIFIYLILWILVPKAQTNSDFLQMKGKPITVGALTDYAKSQELQEDAKLAANRIGNGLEEVFRVFVTALRYVIGLGLVAVSLVTMIWVIVVGTYVLTGPEILNDVGIKFPVGPQETALVFLVIAVTLSAFILLLSAGVAFLRQKWPLQIWATVALCTIFFVGSAVGVGLGAEVAPRLQDRYQAAYRTETRQLPEFKNLEIMSGGATVRYEPATKHYVEVRAFGGADKGIKTDVKDGKLSIDVRDFREDTECNWFCLHTEDVTLTVYSPELREVIVREDAVFKSEQKLRQTDMTIIAAQDGNVELDYVYPKSTVMSLVGMPGSGMTAGYKLEMTGIRNDILDGSIRSHGYEYSPGYLITRTDEFTFSGEQGCSFYAPLVRLERMPQQLTVNGKTFADAGSLRNMQRENDASDANCVMVQDELFTQVKTEEAEN